MSQPRSRGSYAEESCIPSFEDGNQLEEKFECPICLQCLKEPYVTSCGHRFCYDCIKDWLSRGNRCPVDEQIIDLEKNVFPDNVTRREIQDLQHSPHLSCVKEEKSELSDQQIVECRFRDVGCGETLPNNQLDAHLETEVHSHLDMLSTAYAKLKTSVEEQQLEAKALEADLWVPDAKGQCNHNEESPPQLKVLVRSLYERIVLLEQRNREQDIQLENMKQQIKSINEATSGGIERLTEELKLRYCGGTYVWRIPGFTVQLDALMADPGHMLYSPGFYISPNGYRFCARINVSPRERDYLSLILHLMKGENDDSLQWPFNGRIRFTFINGLYPHRHLQETMISPTNMDAFKRPVNNMNTRGFGYFEFIAIQDLRSQGFLFNDRVQIKVEVQNV